jgi:hypothetical protein
MRRRILPRLPRTCTPAPRGSKPVSCALTVP